MVFDMSPGWASAGAAAFTAILGYLRSVDAAQESRIKEVKGTQSVLFAKLDDVRSGLETYKTHVAETYANRVMLEKLFEPLNRRLEAIERDLRGKD